MSCANGPSSVWSTLSWIKLLEVCVVGAASRSMALSNAMRCMRGQGLPGYSGRLERIRATVSASPLAGTRTRSMRCLSSVGSCGVPRSRPAPSKVASCGGPIPQSLPFCRGTMWKCRAGSSPPCQFRSLSQLAPRSDIGLNELLGRADRIRHTVDVCMTLYDISCIVSCIEDCDVSSYRVLMG